MNPVRDTHKTQEDTAGGSTMGFNGMNQHQIRRYTTGFVGSVLLTLAAYFLVTGSSLAGGVLIGLIVTLAVIQLLVQLVCFLHLGEEERPRWRTNMFLSMVGVLLIVVFGSIWIMNNLDYHMMTPHQTDEHMKIESNKGF